MEAQRQEPVPRAYPMPQVEVDSARGMGPVTAPARANGPADHATNAIDVQFSEIAENGSSGSRLGTALKAIWREAVMPALEKLIPQGAAEIAQALNTGNGYVPYGPTEKPVPIDHAEGGVHGQGNTAPSVEPLQQQANGYQVFEPTPAEPVHGEYNAMLAEAAQIDYSPHDGRDRDRGMDH